MQDPGRRRVVHVADGAPGGLEQDRLGRVQREQDLDERRALVVGEGSAAAQGTEQLAVRAVYLVGGG
jgi:hypothetical protein